MPRLAEWLSIVLLLATTTTAQTSLSVSTSFDTREAPEAIALPGLAYSSRAQILIEESRLKGLRSKRIVGVRFRRDLSHADPLIGGAIDFIVRLSTTAKSPALASASFATNAPASTQQLAFQGTVKIPSSPRLGASPTPWAASNSFTIRFGQSFTFKGGTLCIDIIGIQQKNGLPEAWFVDSEFKPSGGTLRAFGTSCYRPQHTAAGRTLRAASSQLLIGGNLKVLQFGRPGATPIMMIGASANPVGIDLTRMGATGCRSYVNYLSLLPLTYGARVTDCDLVATKLEVPIPFDRQLLGVALYLQGAEDQSQLLRSTRTNPAGLTLSEGLEVRLASTPSTLGMATVSSAFVYRHQTIPTSGYVNLESAPVLRILFK